MIEFILVFILWWLSGVASFIYWWTKDYDYTASDVFISICIGFVGPTAFLFGWSLHGTDSKCQKKVIFKKR